MKRENVTRSGVTGQPRGCWSSGRGEKDGEGVRKRARSAVGKALPDLLEALLAEARTGSALHLKLLFQLERDLNEPEQEGQREKNLEEILMEQWARDEQRRLLVEG